MCVCVCVTYIYHFARESTHVNNITSCQYFFCPEMKFVFSSVTFTICHTYIHEYNALLH